MCRPGGSNDLCKADTVASKQFVSLASSADVGYSGVSNQSPADVHLCTVAQLELLKLVRHKVMVFEFDRKFTDWTNAGGTEEYAGLLQKFKSCGYEVTQQIVDARQFGSSLSQPRLVVMGVAHGVGHTVDLGFRGVVAELTDSPYFGSDAVNSAVASALLRPQNQKVRLGRRSAKPRTQLQSIPRITLLVLRLKSQRCSSVKPAESLELLPRRRRIRR